MKTLAEKICEQRLADTVIFLVREDSSLCARMLEFLRSPGTMSSGAARLFETGWALHQTTYGVGGVLGVLVYGQQLRSRGPAVMMGKAEALPLIVEALNRRARELTRLPMTPVICEPDFEEVVSAVIARVSETAGAA